MRSLSALSLRRPALALVLFLALTLALAVAGGSRDQVQPTNLKVDGTESARAQALIAGRFDEASTVPILLSGPSKEVRSQGLALSKRLAKVPGVTVASPWNAPSLRKVLRPADDQLLMLASITGSKQEIQSRALRLRTTTEARTTGPVEAHVTGVPLLTEALTSASGKAVHRVDLIAIPVLLVVLLLVFRSPLAAALPVLLGGATILAATGGVRLLSTELPVDGLGTALASMMGLALAVDYSLLMVSRFREERRRGLDVREAAAGAVVGTRHTVMTAGASILLAMVLVAVLGPGSPVVSAALGVGVAAIVAVLGAALAMPAALVLTGRWIATAAVAGEADHVASGRDGRRARASRTDGPAGDRPGTAGRSARAAAPGVWERVGTAAMRRPAATVGAGCIALALLAIPLLSLQTSAPDSGQLPPKSAARADVDAVTRAVGAGWGTSFELVAVADRGTMTTTSRLRALSALQTELAKDPDVRAVVGPGTISKTAAKLRRDGRRLLRQQKALAESLPAQSAKLSELKGSVGELEGGVGGLNGAFSDADSATKTLSTGSSSLEAGVSRLREGVAGASAGVKKLVTKVGGALVGVGRLEEGAGQARAGSAQIASAIHELGGKIAQVRPAVAGFSTRFTEQRDGVARAAAQERTENAAVLEQIKIAQQALTGVRANNSAVRVAKALEAVKAQVKASQVAAQLDAVAGGLNEQIVATNALASRLGAVSIRPLAQRARELTRGLAQLQAGLRGLSSSVSDLSGGSAGFQAALSRLDGGAGRLGSGVEQLKAGVSGVAKSVDASRERSDGLVRGLTGAKTALDSVSTGSPATAKRADGPSATAKAIDSGYFVLAALDGQGSATGLNVERGGQAARVVIVPRTGPSDPRTKALYERLTDRAERFSESTKAQAAIGGPAAQLIDYEQAADHRFPIIVLVLALATTLLLAVLLRSLVVPVIGVALTLLTVAATLGAMSMLFGGGLDATTVIAVFAVMFALSIDYQVFILGRIREEFDRRRDAEAAITAGLASTAHVVTGAGVSMLAVFLAFASADVPGLRQFGLGLAIAVALDATVVRLVVLPAALKLAGGFAWGDPPAERRSEAGRATDRGSDAGPDGGLRDRVEDRRRAGEPDRAEEQRRPVERRAGAGRRADEGHEAPRTRPAMGSAD